MHPDDQETYDVVPEFFRRARHVEIEYRLVGYDGQDPLGVGSHAPEARPRRPAPRGRHRRRHHRAAEGRGRPRGGAPAQLADLAYHDSLTGLPNRVLLPGAARRRACALSPDTHPLAVIFLDLDDFKLVNDTFGHAAGDELLCAGRRRGCARATCATDVVARQGGDEFLVLFSDLGHEAAPRSWVVGRPRRSGAPCSEPVSYGRRRVLHRAPGSAWLAFTRTTEDAGRRSRSAPTRRCTARRTPRPRCARRSRDRDAS